MFIYILFSINFSKKMVEYNVLNFLSVFHFVYHLTSNKMSYFLFTTESYSNIF